MTSIFAFKAVLRGSKTNPGSLRDALDKVTASHEEVLKVVESLAQADNTVQDVEDSLQTHLDPDAPWAQELLSLVEKLHDRVHVLEKEKKEAEEAESKSNEAVTRTLKQLVAGGAAGATARTVVAPLDRVKILMQTQFLTFKGVKKYNSVVDTMKLIHKEEGFARLWRGNVTNIVRVAPYSATQFTTYDVYKRFIYREWPGKQQPRSESGEIQLSTPQRLVAGAMAGATATSITHPLDVIRLRLNVEPDLKGAGDAIKSILAENGPRAFFKGYAPTLLSLSSFIAINFASFDFLKTAYPDSTGDRSAFVTLGLGACAGLFAQSICFPLDTVRRRMQMKGTNYSGTLNAFTTIVKVEGPKGFYKGMQANAIKVVPNNAIRFMAFEQFKKQMGLTPNGSTKEKAKL